MSHRRKVLELATREHAGQKRKDGKDYITHPIAVEVRAIRLLMKSRWSYSDEKFKTMLFVVSVVAFLHDVLEDCDITAEELRKELLDIGILAVVVDMIMEALLLLTKKKGESYYAFVERIKDNSIAVIVKLADLEHNLSDLEPGNLRDKYLFATYYLTH